MKSITTMFMTVFLVCILTAGIFIAKRLNKVEPGALAPKVNFEESMKNYQQRMWKTERMLLSGGI